MMKKRTLMKTIFAIVMVISISSCKVGNMDIDKLQEEIAVLKEELNSKTVYEQQLEANKSIVTNFFKEVFIELKLDSIHKYIGEKYIQHDPNIADGKQALINQIDKWFKHMSPNQVDIIRVFAEDDMVFIHTKNRSVNPVMSLMHVFRIENNMIVEHWVSVQPVPENPKNNNTLF